MSYIFLKIIFILIILFTTISTLTLEEFLKPIKSKKNKMSKELSTFLKWVRDNGGYINNKIEIVEDNPLNRYVRAVNDIKQKEILLFIPKKILISQLTIYVFNKCKKFNFIKDEGVDFDCLVYFLTIDKYNKTSFYKPYYDILPKSVPDDYMTNMKEDDPIFAVNNNLKMYKNNNKKFIKRGLDIIEDDLKIFAEKNNINKEEIYKNFIENFFIVSSRNFGRPNRIIEVSTMVPYLDMINHSDNPNVWWYYDESISHEGYTLFAYKNIKKNEQIFDSYGKHNNLHLYSVYGFTLENNKYKDSVPISINKIPYTLTFENLDEKIKLIINSVQQNNEDLNEGDIKKMILKIIEEKIEQYEKIKPFSRNIEIIIKEQLEILNIYRDTFLNMIKN